MPNLQAHMFRVAAVAALICDNFDEPLPRDEIITVCLLHDMGNIVKSSFEFLPELLQPEGPAYWQKVKDEYLKKYGKNDHEATMKIIKELDLAENILQRANRIKFSLLCEQRDGDDFVAKIISYADGRVDPYGIVSYVERMNEVKIRYKDREDLFPLANREKLIGCGLDLEKQIFAKCKIKPEDINNRTAQPIILSLRDFVVK